MRWWWPFETKGDLRAQRDHYKKVAEEGLGPIIHQMHYEGGEFSAQLRGPVVEFIAVALVSQFKAGGSSNFMEMNLFDRDDPFQRYTVTVQKVGALSPADKAKKLADALTEAEQFIERYSGGGETDFRAKLRGVLIATSPHGAADPPPALRKAS